MVRMGKEPMTSTWKAFEILKTANIKETDFNGGKIMSMEIQIFKPPEFGEVRVIGDADKVRFCLADVCKILELPQMAKVVQRLDKEVLSTYPLESAVGIQQKYFINEDGDGKIHCKVHTYWTQKGRLDLYELLKREGHLPLIERTRTPHKFRTVSLSALVAPEQLLRQSRVHSRESWKP